MTRRKVFLIAVTVVVLVGGVLGGIQLVGAMQGGDRNTDMTKSVARIVWNGKIEGNTASAQCTGSVVGDGWVLTALHCDYDPKGNVLNWGGFTVQLWRAGVTNIKNPDWHSLLDRPPLLMSDAYTKGNALYRDVMLLHVGKMPTWAKTIPMALDWPHGGTTLTEYGFGNLNNPQKGTPTPADALYKSKPGSIKRTDCPTRSGYQWTNGHICASVNPDSSLPWPGDSGGPLLWWVNGYWQQVGTFSLFPRLRDPDRNWRSYWSEADGATRNWILSWVFSPNDGETPGNPPLTKSTDGNEVILRDRDSGASWLYLKNDVKENGKTYQGRYRHWIPDGGTYNCLANNGVKVLNLPLRTIEALPDMKNMRDQWASCTPRPVPTSPPAPTVTPHTAPTVTPSRQPTVTPAPPHPHPTVTPIPPQSHPVNAYDNYGQSNLAGHAMCRGNPGNSLSMPGGTASQTFTVPAGVASLNSALVQIDPDSRVTAHLSVAVNGNVVATVTAAAAGDTRFNFGPITVHTGNTITLSISFTATYGKIITVYTVGNPGGTFTASNSCPDGAPNFSTTSSGLRAVVSGVS